MNYLTKNYNFIPVRYTVYGMVIFYVPYLVDKFYKLILIKGTSDAGAKLICTGNKGYAILGVAMAIAVTFTLTCIVVQLLNNARPESGVCQYASWIAVVVIALIMVIGCMCKGMIWSIVVYKCGAAILLSIGVWIVSFVILSIKTFYK